MLVGVVCGNAENVGIVVTAGFDGFASAVTESGANAFKTIGLHTHTLAGAAEKDAECVVFFIGENSFGDLFGIIIEIILGVISVGTKIGVLDLLAFEPVDDVIF